MLFRLSTFFLHKSHSSVLNISRDFCSKIGKFQPSVAYKSVAYKKKRVHYNNEYNEQLLLQTKGMVFLWG